MKRDTYRPVWVIVFVATGLVALAGMSRHFVKGKELVAWREDFESGRAEAAGGGKRVLVYFTASWCGPCQEMRRQVWTDAAVAQALAGYVPIRIDVDQQPGLARQYQVEAMPSFLEIDPQGRTVRATTGYMDAPEFVNWLKR